MGTTPMRNPPADPAFVRCQLHLLAHHLMNFVEAALVFDPDPEEIADHRARGHRLAEHPNLPAHTHNMYVSFALEPLIPFLWFDGQGEPPPFFVALAELLDEVLVRWGWPFSAREGDDHE